MTGPQLDASDAAEFTEMLNFLIDWTSHDETRISASPRHFAVSTARDAATLRADLARICFLLGGSEEHLFPGNGEAP